MYVYIFFLGIDVFLVCNNGFLELWLYFIMYFVLLFSIFCCVWRVDIFDCLLYRDYF